MNERLNQNPSESTERAGHFAELLNEEVFELLHEQGMVDGDSQISEDDFDVIKTRANVIVESNSSPVSDEAALMAAYVDRMELKQQIGQDYLRSLPDDALRSIFYAQNGVKFTDEELSLFRNSELPTKDWVDKRTEVREGD